MVDAGWPGSLPALKSQLRVYGIQPAEIRFVLITHTHPDHAGLAQDIKQMAGARLILHEKQRPFLPELEASLKDKGGYIGDLHLPQFASDEIAAAVTRASWQKLLAHGVKTFYPAHGEPFQARVVERALAHPAA
jgi:glyoxylase-like metal-dependent hydrolase (beta-lactamase superfamily II)